MSTQDDPELLLKLILALTKNNMLPESTSAAVTGFLEAKKARNNSKTSTERNRAAETNALSSGKLLLLIIILGIK
jgi:hypothetical protein